MEPIGLAVGVVGLAGLFTSCLEAVEKVHSYKNFGRDSRSLATQFDADKHRFEEWGRAVGFEKGKLSDSHHPALDDAQKLEVVRKLLGSIQDFCSSAGDARYQQHTQPDDGFAKDISISARQSQPRYGAPIASRWRKTTWALSGKTKQTGHIQTFALLVQYLYNVVPPHDATDTLSKHRTHNPGPSQDSVTVSREIPWLEEIRGFLHAAEEEMRAETKRDLRAWLGCPSPNDLYDDSIKKRLDGTCEWILERDEIRNWLSSDISTVTNSLLWINGPAGFGKTILCARLVEILSTNLQTPVSHFFLSSKFEGRDDPFMALRSWVAEVTLGNQVALDVVYKRRLAQHEQVATRATLVQLFREVVQAIPFCTFILDGLDECTWLGETQNGANSVAHFLSELRQAIADTTARIMVISRNELEIRYGLSQFPGFSEYTISPEDVHTDNIAYSRSIVDNKLSNKDESTRFSISHRMALRCNGQFQWLKMQEDFLRKGRNRKQLEKDIDAAPAGLDRLYDRNWERIEGLRHEERTRALSLLRWAAFSMRPLTVFEISGAVLIDEDCDDLPLDEMPDSVDDDYVDSEILGLCGSLIEVRGSLSPAGLREVHLAHFSVKQYLLFKIPSCGVVLLANEKLRAFNESIEGTALAKLCLQYIRFPRVWDGSLDNEKEQVGVSFRNYAAEYWYQHTELSEINDNALMEAMKAFFDGRDQTWGSWRQWF
ncbi:prion-inhibition and propagation-domain-containing protein, partial [Colletotrichum cereale]